MGLLDLQTDLKSLKFGQDRLGGGSSGQPYIESPIDEPGQLTQADDDFLLRGGVNAPLDAAKDVERLAKYFGDLKSPSGVLFVAKQQSLSRIGVATQASGIEEWQSAALNEGLYTPLSTLAQAGINFAGGHIPKQGAIPFKGVRTYSDVVKGDGVTDNSIVKIDKNRLVTLLNEKQLISPTDNVNVYSYSGGPGSALGIGKTNIKFATDNLGAPLRTGPIGKTYLSGIGNSNTDRTNLSSYNPLISKGVTTIFKNEFNPESIEIGLNSENDGRFGRNFQISVYNRFNINDDSTFPLQSTTRIYDNGALVWDQEKIEEQTSKNNSTKVVDPTIQDFRAPLLEGKTTSTVTGIAPNYSEGSQRREGQSDSRINMVSPGQKGDVYSYTTGKIVNDKVSTVDRINALPIYTGKVKSKKGNDLAKFRIASIGRDGTKTHLHFRAFITGFSDKYGAKWNGIKYMGRGEEFYKYGGFSRNISVSFIVAAQSKPELMVQYKKLNQLASMTAPDYGSSGYMGGVISTLTMGGWCYEQPGFITDVSLEIPEDSPWEIAINDQKNEKAKGDPTVKELPHRINVSLSFTPIHQFRPEIQTEDGEGPARFLALSTKEYGNKGSNYTGTTS